MQAVKKEEGEEAKEGEKDAENKEANGAVSTGEDAAVEGGKHIYWYTDGSAPTHDGCANPLLLQKFCRKLVKTKEEGVGRL